MEKRKPKPPRDADDKEQSERFMEAAQELDVRVAAPFEKAFKAAVPPKKPKRKG